MLAQKTSKKINLINFNLPLVLKLKIHITLL